MDKGTKLSSLKIAIILGSTRPNRVGEVVAKWVKQIADKRTDAEFDLIDLENTGLPLLDEGIPPMLGQYDNQHTKDWAARIAPFDGFLFVTAEYNHSVPAALKNALDFLNAEWNNKAAGFVSYGVSGGIRSVEHLRLILAELRVATVRDQVSLNSYTDFDNFYDFHPTEQHVETLNAVFDDLVLWGTALKSVRK